MLSNDILRSLRYTLKANNNDMVRILALADMESISANFDTWTTKEDEDGFVRCPDIILSGFLNGLIYHLRGKDESAPELALERRVNNNTVLKKLRIAFSLKTDDILAIMTEQKFRVSMPEITAMMRAPDHKNYRECGDQFLRYFLRGLTSREHKRKRKAALATTIKIGSPKLYFTSLKPADSITVCICFMLMFLSAFSDSFIPEMACNAFISTFSISIVTFSCA